MAHQIERYSDFMKYRMLDIIFSGILLFTVGACSPNLTVVDTAATERALVASLTALAEDTGRELPLVATPIPSEEGVGSRNADIEIVSIDVENNYPNSITFEVVATSKNPLRRVAFFYWLQGQDSRNLETVEFVSGDEITASYTWDTARITVAPSTPIYFSWELEDESGNIFVSADTLVYYDDLRFAWKEIRDDEIIVRWYDGDQDFGGSIFSAARESLDRMKSETGAELEFPIFVILYANSTDFASWHYYVEDWVGGQAFTPLGVTTQILSPQHGSSWITEVIPHEIAHLFFYQQIQSNLASWPSWMDEGFAQYYEFTGKNQVLNRVEQAARNGELTPLRYIGGSFGHDPEEVRLAYDESLSVIVFLLETWGKQGLQALIDEIRTGATISVALSEAFSVTFEEFEALWITWLGTPATPRPSPTMIPTFGVIGMPTPVTRETPSP
ncbi:MAG: hypothetical protein E4G99_06120 [Anaerolineales bacterium]|nr:MAG: hypothetical protein E4G99_06120 [Anaerolineales bacterium]